MTDNTAEQTLEQLVEAALSATFDGDVPDTVDALVDRGLCAKLLHSAKIGFVVRLGDDPAPRIRIEKEDEADRLRDALAATWPAAAAFFDDHADDEVIADVGAGDGLKLLSKAESPRADGSMGDILWLPSGTTGTYSPAEAPPSDLPDGLAARVQTLVDAGAKGLWMTQRAGDEVASVAFVAEYPYEFDPAALATALGSSDRFEAVAKVFSEADLDVDPWMIELRADGADEVCLWGIRSGFDSQYDAPDIFTPGSAPEAGAFASYLGQAVPGSDRDAAEALLSGQLHPALAAIGGDDPHDLFVKTWGWAVERLAGEVPFERIDSLRVLAGAAEAKHLETDAFHLALARYLKAHPEAQCDAQLDEATSTASVEALQTRANEGLARLAAISKTLAAQTDVEARTPDFLRSEIDATRDTFERAISGDFTAAEGLMHDFLMDQGPGGYDDDPSMASLDDIDLDAEAMDAAIEEALALDDDEEFEF